MKRTQVPNLLGYDLSAPCPGQLRTDSPRSCPSTVPLHRRGQGDGPGGRSSRASGQRPHHEDLAATSSSADSRVAQPKTIAATDKGAASSREI